MSTPASIRRFRGEDEPSVVDLWFRCGKAVYTFLPAWRGLTLDMATRIFRQVIRPQCEIWVAEPAGRIVAYMALDGPHLDRLYVDPPEQRRGWGTQLVELAKRRRPRGLTARTHQENHPAQAFFEKLGFEPTDFGVSPPPECAPDVVYQWPPRPSGPDSGSGSWP